MKIQLPNLNLPKADLKIKKRKSVFLIWDLIRKNYFVLTPEEWVRQNLIHFLIFHKNFPKNKIALEKQIQVANLKKRYDAVVFSIELKPLLLIECKAPAIPINQKTFDQAARYNLSLKVPYLLISNGLQNITCKINHQKRTYNYYKEIPEYSELTNN